MIKNSKRKNIENNEIMLHYLKGCLNTLENICPYMLEEYVLNAKSVTIDMMCKTLGNTLNYKDIKAIKQGAFNPKDEKEILIYKFINYISCINSWNKESFDYKLFDIRTYDYNEIIEEWKNYNSLFSIRKNKVIKLDKINELCNFAKKKYNENNNSKNISDLCDFILKLEKVFKDKYLINFILKRQMFNLGFTIGRYMPLEDIEILNNNYNYTTSEVRNNIINIYVANYEKLFSSFNLSKLIKKVETKIKAEDRIKNIFNNNKNRYISRQEIQEQTLLSEITVKRYLIKQQKCKKIKKIGAKKNSKYILIGG